MNILDLNLPDLSDHPPPPQASLGEYEKWVFELLACGMRPAMTDEQIIADFMKNEGSQTEEWPDFGTCAGDHRSPPPPAC
jgi:hypothetical protein